MSEPSTDKIISLSHGDVYKWRSGVCLRALQDVELMFPGVLVQGSEAFGSIIELSDRKTQIGVVPNRNGQGFESINVRLKAQCSLRLRKDTETVITFDSTSPSLFEIEGT
jgi:hypothetical protein